MTRNAENIGMIGQGMIDGNSGAFIDPVKASYVLDFDPQCTRQGKSFTDTVLQTGDTR